VRSGKSTVGYGRYFQCGIGMGISSKKADSSRCAGAQTGMSSRSIPYWGRRRRSAMMPGEAGREGCAPMLTGQR
jgi:hypothetical protein